jgi:alpha-1,2-mannosyltransferase
LGLAAPVRQLILILSLNLIVALSVAAAAIPFGYTIIDTMTGSCTTGWLGDTLFQDTLNSQGIPGCNTLSHSYQLLKGAFRNDSWQAMRAALESWRTKPEGLSVFEHVLRDWHFKFQYPPTTILIPWVLDRLDMDQNRFKTITTFGFLALMIGSTTAIAWSSLQKMGENLSRWRDRVVLLALVGLLALTYYPIVKACTLGQIQVWLNAFFALSLFLHMSGRTTLAGILVGAMASVKPQYGLFLLWGAARRDWRFCTGLLGSFTLGTAVGVSVFGPQIYLDYFDWLGYLSRHGEGFYPNQSINGLGNRIFSIFEPDIYPNTTWTNRVFAPYNPWVHYSTIITSIAFIVCSLLAVPTNRQRRTGIDYSLMALAATLASPIVWEHHYGIMLAIFAVLWPLLWFGQTERYNSRRSRFVLIVCFLLSANLISIVNMSALTVFNFIQSYLFFSSMGVFVIMLQMSNIHYAEMWHSFHSTKVVPTLNRNLKGN